MLPIMIEQQITEENHIQFTAQGIRMSPIVCRLITPGEMGLMARIAGMRLIQRFANWQRSTFDINSKTHISIYGFNKNRPITGASGRVGVLRGLGAFFPGLSVHLCPACPGQRPVQDSAGRTRTVGAGQAGPVQANRFMPAHTQFHESR